MSIKRIIALCVALFMAVTFISCSSASGDNGKLNIVTTNFALYDFARAVCGDSCNVTMLISPGSESHDFEATLTDMAVIEKADLFVYIGGESEEWVDSIFESMGKKADAIKKIRSMDLVEIYTEEELPGMGHDDHDHDHRGGTPDEHVWTSIPNAITIMEKIAAEVTALDGELSESVSANFASYKAELEQIHHEFSEAVSTAKRRTIVVADRFPFRYLTEEYDLEYFAAFSGCSSDTEPTLSTVNVLVENVKSDSIPVLFIIEFSGGETARAVANETGASILTLHSAHNVTREDFDAGITYADIMRQNLEALKTALN